jgi:hypothetical protein
MPVESTTAQQLTASEASTLLAVQLASRLLRLEA